MSKRPRPLTLEQQLELGAVVLAMRDADLPWKSIEREFGMTRRHLWRCAQLMSQQRDGMSHREPCSLASLDQGLSMLIALQGCDVISECVEPTLFPCALEASSEKHPAIGVVDDASARAE